MVQWHKVNFLLGVGAHPVVLRAYSLSLLKGPYVTTGMKLGLATYKTYALPTVLSHGPQHEDILSQKYFQTLTALMETFRVC